jgi:hypothetical protein
MGGGKGRMALRREERAKDDEVSVRAKRNDFYKGP